MKDSLPRYTLRINRLMLSKLKYVSEVHGRSINKELEQLIVRHVKQYEKENGPIPLEDLKTDK